MTMGVTIPFSQSDDLSLFNTRQTKVEAGGGTVTIGTNPSSGAVRGKAALMAGGASTSAYRRFDLSKFAHATNITAPVRNHLAICIELNGLNFNNAGGDWNDGATGFVQTLNSALSINGIKLRLQRLSGAYYYQLLYDPSVTVQASRALPKNTRHDLRLKIVRPNGGSSGALVLQTKRDGESAWTTEINVTNISGANNNLDIAYWQYGVLGTSGLTGTVNVTIACEAEHWALSSNLADLDRPSDMTAFWRGCHALDTDTTQATIRAHLIAGEWAGATHARVKYAAGSSAVGGTTTAAVAISSFDTYNNNIWTLTGLTPNTAYAGVIEVATSSGFTTIVATSHTFRFKTAAEPGVVTPAVLWCGGCMDQSLDAMPYAGLESVISQLVSQDVPADMKFGGDFGYESSECTYSRGGSPIETAARYTRMMYQCYCDDALHRLTAMGAMMCMPDDHTVINDGDGRMRPGGSLYSTLANDWPDKQGTYSGSVTLGQLYDRGIAVHESWWTNGWLARAAAGEFYGAYTRGRIRFIVYDARWRRDPTTPTMLGAEQKTWLLAQIVAAAADTNIDLIWPVSGGPHWNIGDDSTDNWFSVAPNEVKDVLQQFITSVRSNQRWPLIVSDRHMLGGIHKLLPNGTGSGYISMADARFLGEYILCPVSSSAFAETSGARQPSTWANTDAVGPPDRRLWFVNPATAGNPSGFYTQWAYTSGMLFKHDPEAGTLDHWFDTPGAAADDLAWGEIVASTPTPSAQINTSGAWKPAWKGS